MKTITLKNKKQGFTLIEIIIVIVILGILAAVALPKLTSTIGKSAASEAFQVGGAYFKAVENCVAEQTAGAPVTAANMIIAAPGSDCVNWGVGVGTIGLANPAPTSNFATYVTGLGVGTIVTFTATPVAKNGLVGADTIVMTYDASSGAKTRVCNGAFANMCK